MELLQFFHYEWFSNYDGEQERINQILKLLYIYYIPYWAKDPRPNFRCKDL